MALVFRQHLEREPEYVLLEYWIQCMPNHLIVVFHFLFIVKCVTLLLAAAETP